MRRPIARRGDAELVEDFLFAADGDGTELRLLGSGYPLVPAWDAYFRGLRDASRQALLRLKVLLERPVPPTLR